MRILRKINKGAVLSAIIILGIIVYLFIHSAYNKAQIPELQKLSNEFIAEHQKLVITPDNLKPVGENLDLQNGEHEKALKELEDKAMAVFEPLYHDGYINITANDLVNNATHMYTLNVTIVDFQKQIISKTYDFQDNTATVQLTTTITVEYIDAQGIKQKQHHHNQTENIIFEKIDGEWKVIYATLLGTEVVNADVYYSYEQVQKGVYY